MGFECKIAADSLAPCGARLTTFIVSYPRAIHSEIMTHRMLSKSSASSRAIPTEKLIERVIQDPWIPSYIGANQKGMRPGEELSGNVRQAAVSTWLNARDRAVEQARLLNELKVHKGVINRLLEPWMWITVIISGTEWDNFFGLRTHEAAEPHFQHVARMMKAAREESSPRQLNAGEWHMPLIFKEDHVDIFTAAIGDDEEAKKLSDAELNDIRKHAEMTLVKISVGRSARVSYLNHDGKRDRQDDIDLHDKLMVQRPLHAAPAEHVAQAMDWSSSFKESRVAQLIREDSEKLTPRTVREAYLHLSEEDRLNRRASLSLALHEIQSGNYYGFKQYRKTLVDENIGGLMP